MSELNRKTLRSKLTERRAKKKKKTQWSLRTLSLSLSLSLATKLEAFFFFQFFGAELEAFLCMKMDGWDAVVCGQRMAHGCGARCSDGPVVAHCDGWGRSGWRLRCVVVAVAGVRVLAMAVVVTRGGGRSMVVEERGGGRRIMGGDGSQSELKEIRDSY